MAEISEASSSSLAYSTPMDKRPVVVRVKRKLNQERVDAFWLEISERPAKRKLLDFDALSISDSSAKEAQKESKPKRLLVQHVETITNSDAAKDVLQPYLPNFSGSEDIKTTVEERKNILKQDKKQEQLKALARQKHEDLVRSARFEQIWKSRRERMKDDDDSLYEICRLYDVIQVDIQDNNSRKAQKQKHVPVEDNTILCNYLPLLREYIASAAEEIEAEMKSYAFGEEYVNGGGGESAGTKYVYDLYTVEDGADEIGDEATTTYPLLQVNEEDDFYDGPSGSDYATDDSNAEDNPRNDYPDEESSENEKDEDRDPYDYFNGYDSQCEDGEGNDSEEDEEDRRWRHR